MDFKTCTMCGKIWYNREEFINCPAISMLGYQACFDEPEEGLFLFNHEICNCGSTISVPVGKFKDLYKGHVYETRQTGTEECQKLCLDIYNLERCSAPLFNGIYQRNHENVYD